MSSIGIKDLDKLAVEANDLKNYRDDGSIYSKKCAEFLERINFVLETESLGEFTTAELQYLESIKKILIAEEQFSKSSFEARSIDAWKQFLND